LAGDLQNTQGEVNMSVILNIIKYVVLSYTFDLREIGWDAVDWIGLAQDRDQWKALVNTVMNIRVP
jgi:hypothetical protein